MGRACFRAVLKKYLIYGLKSELFLYPSQGARDTEHSKSLRATKNRSCVFLGRLSTLNLHELTYLKDMKILGWFKERTNINGLRQSEAFKLYKPVLAFPPLVLTWGGQRAQGWQSHETTSPAQRNRLLPSTPESSFSNYEPEKVAIMT